MVGYQDDGPEATTNNQNLTFNIVKIGRKEGRLRPTLLSFLADNDISYMLNYKCPRKLHNTLLLTFGVELSSSQPSPSKYKVVS